MRHQVILYAVGPEGHVARSALGIRDRLKPTVKTLYRERYWREAILSSEPASTLYNQLCVGTRHCHGEQVERHILDITNGSGVGEEPSL